MKLSYFYTFVFFATIAVVALLLFPTGLDVVTLYRNSYLYSTAPELLDQLDDKSLEDERVGLEQARVLYLSGYYEEAIELLERMTLSNSDNPESWRQLARTYRTVQEPHQAMNAYEHFLTSAPADSEALYLLDEYYRWLQFPDKSIENLQRLIRRFPDDYYNFEKLVDLYLRTGRGEDAIRLLEQAIAAFPDNLAPRFELGRILLFRRDLRAVAIFDELHERAPERQDFFDGLMSALIIGERREEVLALFRNYYQQRLDQGEYYRRLGQIYLYLSDADGAIQALEEGLTLSPSTDIRLQLIDLYGRTGRNDRAVDHARRLVQDRPERVDFWQIHVDCLAAAGRRQELVAALERYVARRPQDRDIRRKLADAHEWVEDYAVALPIAARLFGEQPEREENRERLARLLYALGSYEKAAAHYAHLLRRRPNSAIYHQGLLLALQEMPPGASALTYARLLYQTVGSVQMEPALLLARLYETRGQSDRADPIYRRLVRAYPDSLLLRTRIGQLLLDSGRLAPARDYFFHVLQRDPNNGVALAGLAEIVHEADPSQALRYLSLLERQRPDDTEIVYRQGLIYETLGDSARMVTYFRRLLEMIGGIERTDLYFLRQKIHALYRTGAVEESQTLLEQARQRYPDDFDTLNDYAEILIARRRYDAALEILGKVPGL